MARIRKFCLQLALALCGSLALSACGAHYAQVPARLNLHPYGRVALVSFYTDQSNQNLSTLATQQFAEALLQSQPGIELLEVAPSSASSRDLTASADSAALARALGSAGGKAPAVFVGKLTLSGVKARAGLAGASSVNVSADVKAELTVRLLTTDGAATVWRSSAAGSRNVGHMELSRRLPSIAGRDPNDAYGDIVRDLVADVTRDLRPTMVRQ